ncbi:hypothetical protein E2320_012636, partial [Naja naja]
FRGTPEVYLNPPRQIPSAPNTARSRGRVSATVGETEMEDSMAITQGNPFVAKSDHSVAMNTQTSF